MARTPEPLDPGLVEQAAARLRTARSALFITGAGISADSGLPTYRGIGGLYEGAAGEDGVPIEELLSGETMERDPALCWKHIARIEEACRGARPNGAHQVIARLADKIERVVVLTQNVDGLHRAAGSPDVIEIHGDVHRLACRRCGWSDRVDDYAGLAMPPACPRCRAIARPDVVLFGEMLPPFEVLRLEQEMSRGFDVVFSIGTTSVFPYIAGPVVLARRAGLPVVEVNPGDSAVTHLATIRIRSRAAPAMTAIEDAL